MSMLEKIPINAPVLTDKPRSDYPLSGAKTGPAWRAAWDVLREWYASRAEAFAPSSVVAERVTEQCPDVSPDTVKNLLLSAFRAGVLVKSYRVVNSRTQAAYRISDEWLREQV